jgi:hypothetical protein
VTIGRNVPLDEAGWQSKIIISDFQQHDYFCAPALNAQNTLELLANFDFSRTRIQTTIAARASGQSRKSRK